MKRIVVCILTMLVCVSCQKDDAKPVLHELESENHANVISHFPVPGVSPTFNATLVISNITSHDIYEERVAFYEVVYQTSNGAQAYRIPSHSFLEYSRERTPSTLTLRFLGPLVHKTPVGSLDRLISLSLQCSFRSNGKEYRTIRATKTW